MSSTQEMSTPRWSTTVADPAALGLAGFAMTTFVLSLANVGLIPGAGSSVLGLALFYGGLAQLLAGMWEFVKGNTFGAVAFSSYGAFWLSFWWLLTNPEAAKAAGSAGVAAYLLAWTIFTAFMTIGAVKSSKVVMLVFIALTLTFLALTIGEFAGSTVIHNIGGGLGLVTALLAWYGAAASVINSTWKRIVLPVGAPS